MSKEELQATILAIFLVLGLVYGVHRFAKKNRVGKGPSPYPRNPPRDDDSIEPPPGK